MPDASNSQSGSVDSRQARLIAAARAQLTDLLGSSERGVDGAPDGDKPADAMTTSISPSDELLGTHIGPYKLLQSLGKGGFGKVYMAEQQAPVRRKVALKIIKPGMDSHEVIARFEAERQALALMDHSNIARVFDGGATEAGRPYFVMELVRGVPITRFCDEH